MKDPTTIPDAALVLRTEDSLVEHLRTIPAEVVLPEGTPDPDVRWPVNAPETAAAVVAALQLRRDRIRRIQEMAAVLVRHEEQEIVRLQYAVGGCVHDYGTKRVESWGTLERWAKAQLSGGKRKSVDLPFGRLAFRAVPAAVRVPDEKVEAFVDWCNRTGNTHLYRVSHEARMKELRAWMEDEQRERPTDEAGVTLVEYYPAARYDTFSIGEDK